MPVGAAIGAAVAGTAASVVQGREAAKSQEKAAKIQQKQQAMQTARERRKQRHLRIQIWRKIFLNVELHGVHRVRFFSKSVLRCHTTCNRLAY